MTKRILRYQLPIDDRPHPIPAAPIVLFGRRERNPFGIDLLVDVWLEMPTPEDWPETEAELEDRQVQVVGTGQPIPDTWTWLGSFIDGALVWHLFEVVQ